MVSLRTYAIRRKSDVLAQQTPQKEKRQQPAHARLHDIRGIDEAYEARACVRNLQGSRWLRLHHAAPATSSGGQWSIDLGPFLFSAAIAAAQAICTRATGIMVLFPRSMGSPKTCFTLAVVANRSAIDCRISCA
jgi:hypothetical protein